MGKYVKKAESRGVVKSDGKLSKQLAEQKKQNPLLADSSKDMPERIVVRVILFTSQRKKDMCENKMKKWGVAVIVIVFKKVFFISYF